MAIMIPEYISKLHNITAGEKRVFKILKELLPKDYIVWYELRVEKKHPDFIIVGPDLGLVVLEIKDWQIGSISKANKDKYQLNTEIGVTDNPQKQARNYMWNIVNLLKKDEYLQRKDPKYKGKPLFNYGHGVIFTRITKKSFSNNKLDETIDKDCIIFQDDLKHMEDSQDKDYLLKKLFSMIPYKFKDMYLEERQIDTIRGMLFKEVKLFDDDSHVFKVMNVQQEQYAKGLGYGHRVIRGVAGSGKTVILVCRAKHLAQVHEDWSILTLCYNTVLASHLKNAIGEKEYPNLEVRHFHDWINGIFKKLDMPSGLYKDKEITDNISKISEDDFKKLNKYDAILIDEGQDLDKEWLEFIVKILRNPEHSHLVLGADGAQNLYNRKYTLKSVGIKASGRSIVMRENYRNTQEILDFAHNFISNSSVDKSEDVEDSNFFINPESSLRNGKEPELIKCEGLNEVVEKIVTDINGLVKKGVDYKDICILYFGKHQLGKIEYNLINNKIPYYPVSKDSSKKKNFKYDQNKVKVSTIHSAKGLDFDYIYMCGFYEGLSNRENESKKLIYVGLTRAKKELKVYYSIDGGILGEVAATKESQLPSRKNYDITSKSKSKYENVKINKRLNKESKVEYENNNKRNVLNEKRENLTKDAPKGILDQILSLFK
jgi:superfamily I DNA and RNA helicase